MNHIYLWCITGMSALLAMNTLWRLWSEQNHFKNENLNDEDRAFAWRFVIFLVFPLLNFLDLRATTVACELLGGYIKSWSYGLLWFHIVPAGLSPEQLVPVYLSGALVQLCLGVCLLCALFFKPHPFLATVINYSAAFIFGFNLIVDPLLALAGLGGLRWQLAYFSHYNHYMLPLLVVHLTAIAVYITVLTSQRIRLRFTALSRPEAVDQLKTAMTDLNLNPLSARNICQTSLLYYRAGLRRRARKQLVKLRQVAQNSLYTFFLDAYLSYRKRNYKRARQLFLIASEFPALSTTLKASFMAASACSAFAEGDSVSAENLCIRALEFDDNCLVARMVKVDVLLAKGKKEQAGEEILQALRKGLNLDLQDKIPLDVDKAYKQICLVDDSGAPSDTHKTELSR